jgi:hypothetical protein
MNDKIKRQHLLIYNAKEYKTIQTKYIDLNYL